MTVFFRKGIAARMCVFAQSPSFKHLAEGLPNAPREIVIVTEHCCGTAVLSGTNRSCRMTHVRHPARWPHILAVIIGTVGAINLAGGVWLAGLRGSLFYGVAGLAMLATAVLAVAAACGGAASVRGAGDRHGDLGMGGDRRGLVAAGAARRPDLHLRRVAGAAVDGEAAGAAQHVAARGAGRWRRRSASRRCSARWR